MLFSAPETLWDPGPYPKEVMFQNIDLALDGKQDIQLVSIIVYIYVCVLHYCIKNLVEGLININIITTDIIDWWTV